MNLDQLTVEIRPRRAWEAVDLGARMAQRWWGKLTLIYVLLSLPVWLALCLIPLEYWYYRLLLFWLLLPLFERPLLYFLSRAVFNDVPGVKEVLKAAPALMLRQLFTSLTWRRLSPSRSMDAPVVILENLRGRQRASRLSTLHREDASPAGWLSIIGFFFVYAVAMGLLIVTLQFANHFFDTPWWQIIEEDGWLPFFLKWTGVLLFHYLYLGFVLVAPFYVAAGFALYLNRRIKLEAWDVEIAFRRMVQKRQRQREKFNSALVTALLCFCLGFSGGIAIPEAGAQAEAENVQAENVEPIDEARAEIKTILTGEDFNQTHTEKTWRLPFELEPGGGDEKNDWLDRLTEFVEAMMVAIANWGELMLWVVVLCLVFYLIFRYRHWFAELAPEMMATSKRALPETLFGLDVSEESLPDDIGASALQLWREGRQREALALLYRACLAQLIGRGLELEDGDTELECLHTTRRHARSLKLEQNSLAYFQSLTAHWRRLAYGHIAPEQEEALKLCSGWAQAWKINDSSEARHEY